MKVRQCQAFSPGEPLALRFPDQFAGVVLVIECDESEATQLIARFVEEPVSETSPSWMEGTRVEFRRRLRPEQRATQRRPARDGARGGVGGGETNPQGRRRQFHAGARWPAEDCVVVA